MSFNWKLCSFWLNILAYLSAIAAVLMVFICLSKDGLYSFLWLIYGAFAFLCWRAFAIITEAAERYLGVYPEDEED